MRLDRDARLERLLQRHSTAVTAEYTPGRPCLFRRNEVLVSAADADDAADHVRRWVDGRDDYADVGVSRLRLRASARIDLGELMSDVSDVPVRGRQRPVAVSPNHLLRGEPQYTGGPFDEPAPSGEAPPGPGPAGHGGRGIGLAILDTGVTAHPWFRDSGWFAERDPDTEEVLDDDLDYRLDAEAGHGTFVAGVALRAAPSAYAIPDRVLDSDGITDELRLVHGLDRVRRQAARLGRRVDVVNLSLGGYTYDDRPSPVLARALGRLGRATVVVAAAGNNGSDRPFWPAALKQVVAVGALGKDGHRAPFSNHGWWVDACAEGEQVSSSFVRFDGPRQPRADIDPDCFRGFAVWSGTSFAAPRVAGAVARLAADRGLSAAEATDVLLDPTHGEVRRDVGVVVDDDRLQHLASGP